MKWRDSVKSSTRVSALAGITSRHAARSATLASATSTSRKFLAPALVRITNRPSR